MDGTSVVRNIGELATPKGFGSVQGSSMKLLHRVQKAAVIVDSGTIVFAGAEQDPVFTRIFNNIHPSKITFFDAHGASCVPGFVDSHTHFIFGGHRADEFFWRLDGMPYMEIHARGGGIHRTMEATRKASYTELFNAGNSRLARMLAMGITTVEGKSGYGLDRETEIRQLEVMAELDRAQPVDIVPTFMGAHSIPPEFKGRSGDYIDFILDQVLPVISAKKLARFVDVFCEKGVFDLADSRRLLKAAQGLGFGLKIHADEIVRLGGSALAAELGAISADHLLKASNDDLASMAARGVIATCLPLTAFSLREPYAKAREMIDSGLAVSLASDLNPGSCYSQSIPMMIALALVSMNLCFEEILTALTLNGAAALGLADTTGSVEEGKAGDFILIDAPSADHLAYHFGMNLVQAVFKDGNLVYQKN
jgi:imidazolonepropionase